MGKSKGECSLPTKGTELWLLLLSWLLLWLCYCSASPGWGGKGPMHLSILTTWRADGGKQVPLETCSGVWLCPGVELESDLACLVGCLPFPQRLEGHYARFWVHTFSGDSLCTRRCLNQPLHGDQHTQQGPEDSFYQEMLHLWTVGIPERWPGLQAYLSS